MKKLLENIIGTVWCCVTFLGGFLYTGLWIVLFIVTCGVGSIFEKRDAIKNAVYNFANWIDGHIYKIAGVSIIDTIGEGLED